ncbi:MAG: TatD family hydrolase, partial [Gemmatimonadetes bacterium]|nr:TatD family hydrolase [Gemmatimonadota bacterium]
FDSHCHLTDERLSAELDAVLERARAQQVTRLVTVASDAEDSARVCELAASRPGVWATAGIHPHLADRADDEALERVAALALRSEVVALGETGLDYHYEHASRSTQRRAFVRQLELAGQLALPAVVHSRAADADTAALVREARGVVGVLHCFAGSLLLLEAGLESGWYISFSGLVSFANYQGADLVRAVPADRLLIETDSPYLAPVPRRGRRNEPAFLRFVAEAVAALRGESLEQVAATTARNACTLYKLHE